MKARRYWVLDDLFAACRGATPWTGRRPSLVAAAQLWREASPEPEDRWSPSFVAEVWARIDARKRRQNGWVGWLSRWAPGTAACALVATAILGAFLWVQAGREDDAVMRSSNYVEVLMVDSLDEHEGVVWMAAWAGE